MLARVSNPFIFPQKLQCEIAKKNFLEQPEFNTNVIRNFRIDWADKWPSKQRHPSAKNWRQQNTISREEMSGRQPQLTDLDDHNCLVRILICLNIEDLLSVADTSKQMRVAAEVALRRKYTDDFELFALSSVQPVEETHILSYNRIWSRGMRFLMRFMRCFGQYVSQLTIEKSSFISFTAAQAIFEHANRYLNISLKKLTVEHYFCFESAIQPFVNVVEIVVNCGISNEHFKWLFPNVQTIDYHAWQMGCIEQHFSELRNLYLCLFPDPLYFPVERKGDARRSLKSIVECFRSNPQLRTLKLFIPPEIIIDVMQSAAELLPSLEHLHIISTGQITATIKPIHFVNVKTFVFNLSVLITIPLQFSNLKHVVCIPRLEDERHAYRFLRWGQPVYDFFRKNPRIVTVAASKEFFDPLNISQMFPNIQQVTIHNACKITNRRRLPRI